MVEKENTFLLLHCYLAVLVHFGKEIGNCRLLEINYHKNADGDFSCDFSFDYLSFLFFIL